LFKFGKSRSMKNTLLTAVYVILAISVIYVSLFFLSWKSGEKVWTHARRHRQQMCICGAPGEQWNKDALRELLQVNASDFEVVKFNNW